MGLQSVRRYAAFFDIVSHITQDLVSRIRQEQAGLSVENLVKGARHVKTQGKVLGYVLPGEFLGQQPPPVRKGKLHLVAVGKYLLGWRDRMHPDVCELTDVFQGFDYVLPFEKKLLFVIKKLPRTSAAKTTIAARWLHPERRWGYQFNKARFSVILFLLKYPDSYLIAGHGPFHEHGQAIHPRKTLATKNQLFDP